MGIMDFLKRPSKVLPARDAISSPPGIGPRTLVEVLDGHVRERGDKVFTRHLLGTTTTELTFAEFATRAKYFAGHLGAAGVGTGDVVLIFLPTSPETLPAFVGAMMIGAIPSLMPCPSDKQHPSVYWPNHVKLLDRIAPRLILTTRENAAQMAEHGLAGPGRTIVAMEDLDGTAPSFGKVSPEGASIALLQHSSGTTSLKKGVALSHDAILRQARSYASRLNAGEADGVVTWLPIYHDMGLIACSMIPLVLGQTVTILDPFLWVGRPATLFDAIARYDSKFAWLPNFAFEHLIRTVPRDYAGDLSRMRAFIDCSEPCKTETFERFADRFAANGVRREMLQVSYAMAETVFAVTQTAPGTEVGSVLVDLDAFQRDHRAIDPLPGGKTLAFLSNGAPIDGISVTIRDGSAILPENRVGEVVVAGDFLFDGYFNDPDTTADRLVDGWYHTRDRGFIRDGELYVLGRLDDLMIISGRNLHANEVELLLGSIRGLKAGRAVAFSVYNDRIASEELVIIAESDGALTREPQRIASEVRKAVFEHTGIDVKDVRLVEPGWLVKTTSGKISRERNKARYLDELDLAPKGNAPDTDRTESSLTDIAKVIARVFRVPVSRIKKRTVATDIAGWDSLAHSTLILEIEQEFNIAFADNEIFGFENVGKLATRAAELRMIGGTRSNRIVAEDDNFSIISLGEPGDGPDLIIFAGAVRNFAGRNMMDFASTFRGTAAESSRQIFVTDRHRHWFTDSFEPIHAALSTISGDRPKVLIGNSMGAYGALKFSPRLNNVVGVLAFAPQAAPVKRIAKRLDREGLEWYINAASNVPSCIVYGEIEDNEDKNWVSKEFCDPKLHTILKVNNCGHNVVRYLNSLNLLGDVLACALDPATMGSRIDAIIASIKSDEDRLRERAYNLPLPKMAEALAYLNERYPKSGG